MAAVASPIAIHCIRRILGETLCDVAASAMVPPPVGLVLCRSRHGLSGLARATPRRAEEEFSTADAHGLTRIKPGAAANRLSAVNLPGCRCKPADCRAVPQSVFVCVHP